MPIRPEVCVTVACDVCDALLTDFDSGTILYFPAEPEARATARTYSWPVTTGWLICPNDDHAHQTALDALMPTS